jgi:hypothetical protein
VTPDNQTPEGMLNLASAPYLGQDPPGLVPAPFAPGLVSTGDQELSIAFSPDGREVFLVVTGPSYTPRSIVHSRRDDSGWTAFREVPFSDPGRTDSYPFVAPDGQRLFFCSSRTIGGASPQAHHSIWVVPRTPNGWAEPRRIEFGGEFSGHGTSPSVSSNGNLYFNAAGGETGSDIFVAEYLNGHYATPKKLGPSVNSDAGDFHPFIAADESYLLFDSQRRNQGLGGNDLYISLRRDDGTWSEARNLGEPLNSAYADLRPHVTADREYLFFASDRPVDRSMPRELRSLHALRTALRQPGNGLQDIYWVSAQALEDVIDE